MTPTAMIETPAPVWTNDGCLAAVPANDNNSTVARVVDGRHGAEFSVAGIRAPIAYDHLPRIIALSGAAGSGKSTVSDFLALRFGYRKSKFAKPPKDMCRAVGMTDDMIEGDQKQEPQEMLGGQTPRHAMQTLGTEWGRNCIGEDFWVNLWEWSLGAPWSKERVIVDDCRFANEAARVRRMGGRVIKLVGRGGIAGGHVSERFDFLADAVIDNDGSIADLQARVLDVIEGWRVSE